ncbi:MULTISPECIES: hypothetical protein [unclassified Actinoplanes]|uniref:hypothetical protein n=1 Tax=unclassified Actinoplanes TaxID=2626549 RepID=UPI0012BAF4F1|nr:MULTISPECIES: hypothetical protein [unclassified Actinoplanes]
MEVDPDTAHDPSRLAWHFRSASLATADWAGCTVFIFPDLEREDLPIFLDERVRTFYRKLCDDVPFLLYFLDPEPGTGTLLSVLCAHARDDQIAQRHGMVEIDPDERLRDRCARLVADAAVYADRLGDDWPAFVDELPLPDDFRTRALRMCQGRIP